MPLVTDALPIVRSHPWYDTRHHTDHGFENIWGPNENPPFFKAAKWSIAFLLDRTPQQPAPRRPLDPAALRAPADGVRLSWLGHSSVLAQIGELNVLLDPVFADRVSPLSFAGPKREVALPLDPAGLPPIDLVLLSHDHYDHLDLDAVRVLDERDRPLFVVPLGVKKRLGEVRAVELDWGQVADVFGLRLHCTPAKHFSGRTPWDTDSTLWSGWFIEPLADGPLAGHPTIYYVGDTGYADFFADVRAHFGALDVVIMPVGAYEPRWFMARIHVDPEQALQAYADLGGPAHGTHFVAVHWGTFDLAGEPLDAPQRLLPEAARARGLDLGLIHVLPVGGQVEVQ